jgi:hypothetical protein
VLCHLPLAQAVQMAVRRDSIDGRLFFDGGERTVLKKLNHPGNEMQLGQAPIPLPGIDGDGIHSQRFLCLFERVAHAMEYVVLSPNSINRRGFSKHFA